MRTFLKHYWALFIPIIVLAVAIWFLFRQSATETNDPIGMVDATSVDVAAEFPGRLDSLFVEQGDTVKTGQLLGVLRTTEIEAIRSQALAAVDAAKGQLELLQQGPRKELVSATGKLYEIAEDQYDLFKKTYDRMQRLYNADVISGQERDIFFFKYQAAQKEMETARLNLEMLQKGTRPELLKSANAIVQQAQHAYELTKALKENTRIYSPANGVITSMVIHQGEIVSIGYPIMSVEKENSFILRFNIRQDQAAQLKPGATATVKVPGCTPETFNVTVSSIAPSLTFANWVPTKDKGQFELRTFTIEFKPSDPPGVQGLRSGMTAALQLPR
ncbi:efflux RND transporter periplasmic adaptor subunit [Paraflavitalea sp. CAU 1676]|uniref:HlyD family secretion protein n=1 Tax=Paraflavitalea sp. CAU 1676 TaxID=3032598 RepID=UPI0023DA4431|nr:efflux RND transporter periplasmic adaptor subunit [Paraflavitalea sp. CAU 1676]MDF2191599.1 efflux RND transporter periplasmic adaptor subunit [Paraflavitalea sp. CAU 1676]